LFLIGQFLKIFSETAWPNVPKLDKKQLAMAGLYKDCTFRADLLTKMATKKCGGRLLTDRDKMCTLYR
jgi:hypothetical protein